MDRIVLPQKFAYLYDEIQHRKVSRFLLTLDRKKVAEAAEKGYTELILCRLGYAVFLREERYWVVARKPGDTSDDFVRIKEIPGAGYFNVPIAMSIEEAKNVYSDILAQSKNGRFYPPRTVAKATQVGLGALDRISEKPDSVMSCPTVWLPYEIIIRNMRLRKVRDYDWEGLQKEGMRKCIVTQEEYEEDPRYWKKNVNADREYFCLEWNEKNDEQNFATDKDTLYRRFVRSIYGQKVWDDNETVVELTVYPGLYDEFYGNVDMFMKFCEALLPENEVEMYRERFEKMLKKK